ncbi:MAG: 1-acyl-sn-glycerol-3-phosphate acyltransferase [Oscillospiraceae bacterium]|nr:1-acyl-sn-glycerol-3-phosphate acyltransferase [Oscillospiraceae bacterium]
MTFLYVLLWCLAVIPAAALLYVIVIFVSGLFIDRSREYTSYSPYFRFLLKTGAFCSVFFSRTRIHTVGFEKLPADGRYLVVGNHRSNFDPIVLFWALKCPELAYISKLGCFRIPFYGKLLCRNCFLEIDKTSPRHSMETINKAAELIKNDTASVGVFPEGTRSKTGRLGEFHDGVLKIAKKAEVPILVMCIENTISIHKNFPLRRTHVTLTLTDVIPVEYVKEHSTHDVSHRVRSDLLRQLGESEDDTTV